MTLHVCAMQGCPNLTERTYCRTCDRVSSRNHRGVSRQARGYDRAYEQERATLLGLPCALALPGCTGVADTADHGPDGLRPACAHCNYADGSMRRRGVETSQGDVSARTARQPLLDGYVFPKSGPR